LSKYAPRRAKKRDAIEPFVVGQLMKMGWRVKKTDWIDLCIQRDDPVTGEPVNHFVEVKSGDKSLTDGQKEDQEKGWKFTIIRSVEEAREKFS